MNPLTLEWIKKAEGDFYTAQRELRARLHPNYDAACFHAQQVAEKYLKAFLQENGQPIPRTHNLSELLVICMRVVPAFLLIQPDLDVLENYSIQFRYPGQTADKHDGQVALKSVKVVREVLRNSLGLTPD